MGQGLYKRGAAATAAPGAAGGRQGAAHAATHQHVAQDVGVSLIADQLWGGRRVGEGARARHAHGAQQRIKRYIWAWRGEQHSAGWWAGMHGRGCSKWSPAFVPSSGRAEPSAALLSVRIAQKL